MIKKRISLKNKASMIIAVLTASIMLFAAVPAFSGTAYAAEPADSEVYAFSAEDDGADIPADPYDSYSEDAAYFDDADIDNYYDDYYVISYADADDNIDTNLTVGSLDEETKEEIKDYRRQNINDSLKIMGQGMLGIFVVMFLIYLVVVILNAVTKDNTDGEDSED